MSALALELNNYPHTNSPIEMKDLIPKEVKNITLQLRRKLCPAEFFEHHPTFLEKYDKGLSLEEALKQFEMLWETHDQEIILLACKNQEYSCGGNVILRLAARQGCLFLFQIIGTKILQTEGHVEINEEFKAHFSCHFLEAAINSNDLDLFQTLCNNPEIINAISVDHVEMPGHHNTTPLKYLRSKIAQTKAPSRTKFTFMLERKDINSDEFFLHLIEGYLIDKEHGNARELLKMLISTRPNRPLADNLVVTRIYIRAMHEYHLDKMLDLFPEEGEFSLEQKLNYLFALGPRVIKATINELAQDVQQCEKLCSQKIEISHLSKALEPGNHHVDPEPTKEALKKFHIKIGNQNLYKNARETRNFLEEIPLKTLALIAREPESQEVILPYLTHMHGAQLAATVPQLSEKILFQCLTGRPSSRFEIAVFQTATEEQLDHFIDLIFSVFMDSESIISSLQDKTNQYRKKLEDLCNKEDKTDAAAKQIYWDLDREFSDSLHPMLMHLTQIVSQQKHLKSYAKNLPKTLRSRCCLSKQPVINEIDTMAKKIDNFSILDFAILVEVLQTGIQSFAISLQELKESCGIEI